MRRPTEHSLCVFIFIKDQKTVLLRWQLPTQLQLGGQCSWKTLCLCRDIPVAPLPLVCTFLMAASLFSIFPFVVKQHQLGKNMRCRKTRAFQIFRDSSSFQWQKEPETWLYIWKEMKNGYSLGQRKHDQRKDNSQHHRKGWENFFGRHQYKRTHQMIGVVPPGSQNLLNLCMSPKPGKGGGLSRQLIESTAWERK